MGTSVGLSGDGQTAFVGGPSLDGIGSAWAFVYSSTPQRRPTTSTATDEATSFGAILTALW
jgi:hypothetical protein